MNVELGAKPGRSMLRPYKEGLRGLRMATKD
jgi:hypothetical protein